MIYLVGDIQGCCDPLDRLLRTVDFSPSRDHVYLLGDLVNRGPDSLGVLQRLQSLGGSATCLLGNHDLHLIAVAHGVRGPGKRDTLASLLEPQALPTWLPWLCQQRLAVQAHGWLMVHAGVLPQWDAAQTLALAAEVECLLRDPQAVDFLRQMYGNAPDHWSDALEGPERWRVVINGLTRLRFCTAQGHMDFATKEGASGAETGFMPWFEVPGRKTAGIGVAFGHWSTLGLMNHPLLLGLDTGCVWGGKLTAARVNGGQREIIQIDCPQSQRPDAGA